MKKSLKLIAGTVAIIGIVFGFLELLYQPQLLALESSPQYPDWLKWIRWSFTAGAIVVYFVVDYLEYKEKSSK